MLLPVSFSPFLLYRNLAIESLESISIFKKAAGATEVFAVLSFKDGRHENLVVPQATLALIMAAFKSPMPKIQAVPVGAPPAVGKSYQEASSFWVHEVQDLILPGVPPILLNFSNEAFVANMPPGAKVSTMRHGLQLAMTADMQTVAKAAFLGIPPEEMIDFWQGNPQEMCLLTVPVQGVMKFFAVACLYVKSGESATFRVAAWDVPAGGTPPAPPTGGGGV